MEKPKKKTESEAPFFRYANSYSIAYVTKLLKQVGFTNIEYNQTLFGTLDEIKEVQFPKKRLWRRFFCGDKGCEKIIDYWKSIK